MIAEIGHFALILAVGVALYQFLVPLYGAQRGDVGLMRAGLSAAVLQLGLVAVAFAALTHAYVISDFSVENVAANSHSAKPLLYKISGVWGNHEGSMVLWVLILALYGSAVALFGGNLPLGLRARVVAVQTIINSAAGAVAVPLVGLLSDQLKHLPNGLMVAATALATPVLLLSAWLLWRGERPYVDTAQANARIDAAA